MVWRWAAPAALGLLTGSCATSDDPQLAPASDPSTNGPTVAALPRPPTVDSAAMTHAPSIDGDFDDWPLTAHVQLDPAGDATGLLDITELQVLSHASKLYLRFDTSALVNLTSSASPAPGLGIAIELPSGKVVRVDLRERRIHLDGLSVPWTPVAPVIAPNHAAREFELRLDLATFGVKPEQSLRVWLEGSDPTEPVDVDVGKAIGERTTEPRLQPTAGCFRVASFNTKRGGLAHAARAGSIRRLLAGVAADVYVLQELDGIADADVATFMGDAWPGDDDEWHVVAVPPSQHPKSVIVTRHPATPIPTPPAHFSGAMVELPTGPIFVIGVHLKCCGSFGSPEDQRRLADIALLRSTVDQLIEGKLDGSFPPTTEVPIVVMGDFNDIGSPDLQSRLTESSTGLRRARLHHINSGDVFTWRPAERVAPALLDMAFYRGATSCGGFVLDSTSLQPSQLQTLHLEARDSLASDHLVVVADFTPGD